MKLFVRNKLVYIQKVKDLPDLHRFDTILEGSKPLKASHLQGKLLISCPSTDQLATLFKLMKSEPLDGLDQVVLAAAQRKPLNRQIKSMFRIVKAGGGLVTRNDRYLMIYRLGRWDLPKGKLDEGEKFGPAAVREVSEECNVSVQLRHKICTTWHTYENNGKDVLKQTRWYAMDCLNDLHMRPQLEENIHDVRWMKPNEVNQVLENSYLTIREVFMRYFYHYPQELMPFSTDQSA
ncbi:ADP-ribose pyrophosphatase YjhB, NUDIX family [Catalinimonas alkaloidigena]|uniref:ADP-ribose pyrophosphatase YjhB, NUDIX family n=1 Tax=Catalinimonas alkaloidigena TaxID=1075417 RepID=A0A1G8XXS4_9BACT|nr:NUDIX domain-containing protein [Catalinimonas alkaloidigena]SDJ95353.1 ADP-ribose pyrophosphatase YjhB, NUDIX family [Catalinimonas alkaloidigena]